VKVKAMKKIRVLHSELNGELGGIESFFYIVDDKITEQYPLSTVARYDIYDKFI
jgi:hypothetical protein